MINWEKVNVKNGIYKMCLLLTLPSANNVTTTNCLISYSTLHSIYILINRNSGNHISTFFPSHYNQMTNIILISTNNFVIILEPKNNYGQRDPHFCQIDKFKVLLYYIDFSFISVSLRGNFFLEPFLMNKSNPQLVNVYP